MQYRLASGHVDSLSRTGCIQVKRTVLPFINRCHPSGHKFPGTEKNKISKTTTKPTKWPVRPVKTQISLGIRPVWSEPSLCALRVAKDPTPLQADSEDSDQTRRMPRLIWVFAGRTCHFVGFVVLWLKSSETPTLFQSGIACSSKWLKGEKKLKQHTLFKFSYNYLWSSYLYKWLDPSWLHRRNLRYTWKRPLP